MNALALLLLASVPPAPSAEATPVLALGKLTWLDAQRLDGKPVRVRVVVDCGHDGLYEAEGAPGLLRCVAFWRGGRVPELAPGRKCAVEGVLRVSYIPAIVIDGQRFEAVLAVEVGQATPIR